MAILHSCCWWRSVRRGAFASVFYTFIYFGSTCIIASSFLHDERRYLAGEIEAPLGDSFLEPETISAATIAFNMFLVCCSTGGLIASVLVVLALKCNQRGLLIPWILLMIVDIFVEFAHVIYLSIYETLHFEPLTATLFTVDLFIVCLNLYCLLCVVSQYQEMRAGRGRANDDRRNVQAVQYITQTHPNNQRSVRTTTPATSTQNGATGTALASTPTKTGVPPLWPLQQPTATATATTATATTTTTGAAVTYCPESVSVGAIPIFASHHDCAIIPEEQRRRRQSSGTLAPACVDDAAGGGIIASSKVAKKHVQFPDNMHSNDDHSADHEQRKHQNQSLALQPHRQLMQQPTMRPVATGHICSGSDGVGSTSAAGRYEHLADAECIVIDLDDGQSGAALIAAGAADGAKSRHDAAPPAYDDVAAPNGNHKPQPPHVFDDVI